MRQRFSRYSSLQRGSADLSVHARPLSFLRAVADALTLGLSERLLFDTISKRARSAIERTPDLLLVGLRNPGYDGTRHNAGEICVERLMAAAGTFTELRSSDGAKIAEGTLAAGATNVLMCLPNSFMNLNGRCVAKIVRRHGLTPSQVLVMHDDLDLAPGRIKIKKGGSSGGHKGIDSCAACLGSADFWRLRIGIGRPPDKSQVVDFVLEQFTQSELAAVTETLDRLGEKSDLLPAALTDQAALSTLLNATMAPSGSVSSSAASAAGADRPKKEKKVKSEKKGAASATVEAPAASSSSKEEEVESKEKDDEAVAPPGAVKEQSWGSKSLATALPGAGAESEGKRTSGGEEKVELS